MGRFGKPTAEHDRLKRLAGAWSARIKHWSAPDAKPEEISSEFLARMDLGGFFLRREMNYGMMSYQGCGLTGWDPLKKQYVGTWADSSSPFINATVAHFDERDVFVEQSTGTDLDGTIVRSRLTTEIVDANQMLFRIHRLEDDGTEWLSLVIEHTRRRFGG